MPKNYSSIRLEMEKIESSLHIRAYVKIRELSLSFYTFKENHKMLKQHLDINDDMDYQLQFEYKPLRWQYHPLQQETYRLLLNFVASAMALIEHTRNIVRETYLNCQFQKEYQNTINQEIKDIPVNKFVQDLRSYILHNKFPFIGIQFHHQRVSPLGDSENLFSTKIRLTFSKNELLKSDKWTKLARNYLDSQGDLIFIDVLIDEYYSLIESFHSWLNKRQREMHESEYSWLLDQWEELYQELEDAVSAKRFD
jgi:hypothetical protein